MKSKDSDDENQLNISSHRKMISSKISSVDGSSNGRNEEQLKDFRESKRTNQTHTNQPITLTKNTVQTQGSKSEQLDDVSIIEEPAEENRLVKHRPHAVEVFPNKGGLKLEINSPASSSRKS
jgi:hypothetical protein